MIKCSLDEDDCIDLLTVLRVINQVNQEQAWAIGYEIGVLMQRLAPANCAPIESLAQIQLHKDGSLHEKTCSTGGGAGRSTTISTTASSVTSDFHQHPHHHHHHHHHLHHHHRIHHNRSPSSQSSTSSSPVDSESTSTTASPPSTPTPTTSTEISTTTTVNNIATTTTGNNNNNNSNNTTPNSPATPPTPPITPELNEVLRRRPALNESELVASLGIALFWALDYGIPDDEERKLSIAMEYLIFQSQSKLSLEEVSQICINRLPIATKSHADLHYRQVCKSLVSDTIELSIFLEKIYTASMVLSDITLDNRCDISDEDLDELGEPLASLRALRINDWARLWMQVIRELRQRGKFKLTA